MDDKIVSAFQDISYKVVTERSEREQIYRLRYKCYRAEGSISDDPSNMMTDPFDDTANCVHVAVEKEGRFLASLRLHLVSQDFVLSPTLEVFPELIDDIENGKTILDPTRFVIDPETRSERTALHFLVLRIPFLAAMHYGVDIALAPVRSEHTAFYRRYLGYVPDMSPRSYPALKQPIHLLKVDVQSQRNSVLARTPVFGPIEDIPNSRIAFPDLAPALAAARSTRRASI